MIVKVIGASIGNYQGNDYGRIYALEPITNNGIGHKPVAYKTSVQVAKLIDSVDTDYNLDFNQYGRCIHAEAVSE